MSSVGSVDSGTASSGALDYTTAIFGLAKRQMQAEGNMIMQLISSALPASPQGVGGSVDTYA